MYLFLKYEKKTSDYAWLDHHSNPCFLLRIDIKQINTKTDLQLHPEISWPVKHLSYANKDCSLLSEFHYLYSIDSKQLKYFHFTYIPNSNT